jgi:hypothetical protein
MKALQIAGSTCVGHPKRQQPEPFGNCFTVKADDGKYYRIANFNLENLEALIEKGLTWPIALKPLGERNALIHDPRIGERWFDRAYCEICTPHAFLPAPQIDRRERDALRGAIQACGEFTIRRLCVPAEFP